MTTTPIPKPTHPTEKPGTWLKFSAWLVHFFTATGSVAGLFGLWFIQQKNFTMAFTMMGTAIAIDATDGTFARRVKIKETLPQFDGALLDNIIDFLNYVVVPAFFLLNSSLLQPGWKEILASLVVLSSCYQFCQHDAKTEDHYFKGFPSYWNVAVFYLYFWQTSPLFNAILLGSLVVLVFVPIKFIYPTRLDFVTPHRWLRLLILALTWVWGTASFLMVFTYPQRNPWLISLSLGYVAMYAIISAYRTWKPLKHATPVVSHTKAKTP